MNVDEKTFTTAFMTLHKSQLDAIHTGRAETSRYLIVGFDTEYQRYADEDTRTLNNGNHSARTAAMRP